MNLMVVARATFQAEIKLLSFTVISNNIICVSFDYINFVILSPR